jgi:predicted RNA-binding Zn ribbon-like protein
MRQAYLTHYIMNQEQYTKIGFGQPALWIDFLNSLEHDGLGNTVDHLRDRAWRRAFLHFWRLAPTTSQAIPFKSLERLRIQLRTLADKLSPETQLRPSELRSLNIALSVFAKPQLIQHQNGFALERLPRKKNWRWIEAVIATSCAETLTTAPLDRLKICPDPLCRWVFYDRTKGKTRRWCNERTCGNRNRVRRARAASKSEN